MRETYQALTQELDRPPIDAAVVLKHADTALLAKNPVKKKQLAMLVKLKDLPNAEQIAYIETVVSKE